MRKRRVLIGLLVVMQSAAVWSGEPNEANVELTFTSTGAAVAWKIGVELTDKPIIRPTHAARLSLTLYQIEGDMPKGSELLETSAAESMSELQREFMRSQDAIQLYEARMAKYASEIPEYNNYLQGRVRVHLFAVSEGDAKWMVRGFMEAMSKKAAIRAQGLLDGHIKKLLDAGAECERRVGAAKKRIAEFPDGRLGGAYKRYEEALKGSAYSLYAVKDAHLEVKKTIFELDKMLDVVDVEIAGLKAKISAIERYSGEKDVSSSPALSAKLREMAIQENVELVGAETRRQVILGLKDKQQGLYGLYNGWKESERQLESLRAELANAMVESDEVQRELEKIGREGRAVRIDEIPVRIDPARVVPRPS